MNCLQRFDNEGLELVIDLNTGEVFASQAAIIRMTGKPKSTIANWAKGVPNEVVKEAEIPTPRGLQWVRLFPENAIHEAFLRYNPYLLKQCAKVGLRVYLHGLVGFRYEAKMQEHKPFFDPKNLTRKEILLLALQAEEENEKLKAELKAQEEDVFFARTILASEDSISMTKFAKAIGIGRNKLFKILRLLSIIEATSTLPYQKFLDAGYFEVSEVTKNEKLYAYALLTPKGQKYVLKKLAEKGIIN